MPAESSKAPDDLPDYLLEDDLSQECKELIATLPAEPGWVANRLHQYQGFWHTTRHMQGVLNCQNHFQAHDSDILLITSPKSGTTWLKALTFALLNRKTYYPNPSPEPTQTDQSHPLLTTNPHVLVPFLELSLYLHKTKPDLSSFSSPRLLSSHLPYVSLPDSVKWSGCKIVYLCRNPKDIFVSLWHFTNNLRLEAKGSNSIEDSFDRFCRGVSLYGPFWDHMLEYHKASLERPDKIMFLRFEELKAEPVRVLKDVAEFIGCGFSREEENGNVVSDILRLCNFENLSNLEVNKNGKLFSGEENKTFFRRGEVGDWKNYLSSEMIQQLDIITQEKLQKHGLKF
ncbi:cytosolic sulfotransferase 12-like [Neltuma alba]|uniref:cytosolic sulfotransferase 12-like n=1 Tax=Neltuma alba TaxID=207710 RepID=UPI0010A553D9|nr:cytosolic sulfotransferase 12-like [Prosopis alba]